MNAMAVHPPFFLVEHFGGISCSCSSEEEWLALRISSAISPPLYIYQIANNQDVASLMFMCWITENVLWTNKLGKERKQGTIGEKVTDAFLSIQEREREREGGKKFINGFHCYIISPCEICGICAVNKNTNSNIS